MEYDNGKQEGEETRFYENGRVKFKCFWKDGKQDGKATRFYELESGKVKWKNFWKDGKKEGEETYEKGIRDANYLGFSK